MNTKSFCVAALLAGMCILCCCATAQNSKATQAAASTDKPMQISSVPDLKQRYLNARTEQERRDVCLAVIDGKFIKRTGPVSAVDEVFGTQFAANLPSRKEHLRTGTVDFLPSTPSSDDSVAAARSGWFLAVTYDSNGEIQNYYLTNLHK